MIKIWDGVEDFFECEQILVFGTLTTMIFSAGSHLMSKMLLGFACMLFYFSSFSLFAYLEQVTTSGEEHWHRINENDSDREAVEKAFQEALYKAKFVCNGDVILPPLSRSNKTEAGVMEWQCMLSTVTATFRCANPN